MVLQVERVRTGTRKDWKIFKNSKTQNTLQNQQLSTPIFSTSTDPNMANPPKETLDTSFGTSRGPEEPESVSDEEKEEVELEELEKLESEAKEMAKRILEYRTTLPDQLKSTLASILSAQRLVLPVMDAGSDFGPFDQCTPGLGEHVKANDSALLTEGDQKIAKKVRLLKDKISSNISAMPIVLKRMKECMSKIENLDSYDGIIHPVFKKQNTS